MQTKTSFGLKRMLRRMTWIGLLILFMLCATLTIFGNPFLDAILDAATYIQLMEKLDLTARSRGIVADLLVSTAIQTENEHHIYQEISIQTWESVAEVVIPDAWLGATYSAISQTFLTWLAGHQILYPPLNIDLSLVKNILTGPDGVLAVLPLLQDVPDCEMEGQLVEIIYFGPNNLVNCWPKNESLIAPAGFIAQTIGDFIPASLTPETLVSMGVMDQTMLDDLLRFRASLRLLESGLRLLAWLGTLFLTLYGLINSSSLAKLMHRLPLPLYLTVGFSLLLMTGIHFFMEWGSGPLISTGLSGMRLEAQILAVDFMREFLAILEIRWLERIAEIFGVAVLINAACWIAGRFLLRQKPASPTPARNKFRIKQQFR